MTRDERRCVQAIHDTSGKMLAAKGPAETYMARLVFTDALRDLDEWVKARLADRHVGGAR